MFKIFYNNIKWLSKKLIDTQIICKNNRKTYNRFQNYGLAGNNDISILSCPKAHIAVNTYFSSTYMSLLSIIQSIVLAGIIAIVWDTVNGQIYQNAEAALIKNDTIIDQLAYNPLHYSLNINIDYNLFNTILKKETLIFLSYYPIHRFTFIGLFVILVWHKYINHHQFLGWQTSWVDSVILLIIGLGESLLLIFSIQNSMIFFYIIPGLIFGGGLAYIHSFKNHCKDYVVSDRKAIIIL